MKKQTKVLVTLSAAALLAVGFSAVSFAEGWDNSTGSWQYLDKDGEPVTNEWKTSNGQKFWLGEDGNMVTDSLIEDDTNSNKTRYYYVDANGAMVTNTWKAVALDGSENTDLDAEYWWYYFGSDGKAYTTSGNLEKSDVKTINGLKYAFDDEGHMLYGWIDADNVDQQDGTDEAWKTSDYYFNGWNDGHAATGWQQIDVIDTDEDDNDQTYWFHFSSVGKKDAGKRKKINGKWYHFADDGHMLDEWAYGVNSSFTANASNGDATQNITYLNGDGAERKNKWVWAVPDGDWISGDNDDDEYSWFYFGNNGHLYVNQIKKINGKKYAFDKYGRMLTGFVAKDGDDIVRFKASADGTTVTEKDDDGSDPKDFTRKQILAIGTGLYYFNEDEEKDGRQQFGYQNIELDDDTYQFYFETKNGLGDTGYISKIKKFTVNGLVLKPTTDDDSNYALVSVGLRRHEKDGKYTYSYENPTDVVAATYDAANLSADLVLVNKSGTIVKANSGSTKTIKDENDVYYTVDEYGYVVDKFKDKTDYDDNYKDSNAALTKNIDTWYPKTAK